MSAGVSKPLSPDPLESARQIVRFAGSEIAAGHMTPSPGALAMIAWLIVEPTTRPREAVSYSHALPTAQLIYEKMATARARGGFMTPTHVAAMLAETAPRIGVSSPIWGTPQRVVLAPPEAYRIGEHIDLDDDLSPWTVRHICRKTIYVPPAVGGRGDVAYVCEPVRWFAKRWLSGSITSDEQSALEAAVAGEAGRRVMLGCSSRSQLGDQLAQWLDIDFVDVLRLCKMEDAL